MPTADMGSSFALRSPDSPNPNLVAPVLAVLHQSFDVLRSRQTLDQTEFDLIDLMQRRLDQPDLSQTMRLDNLEGQDLRQTVVLAALLGMRFDSLIQWLDSLPCSYYAHSQRALMHHEYHQMRQPQQPLSFAEGQ